MNENSKKTIKSSDKDKTKLEEYNESLRDLKTSWLSKLGRYYFNSVGTNDFIKIAYYKLIDVPSATEKLYEELCTEYPDHLPIHVSFLQSIISSEAKRQLPLFDENELKNQNRNEPEKIINICNKVLNNINMESLLAYYAIKNDCRSDSTKIKR